VRRRYRTTFRDSRRDGGFTYSGSQAAAAALAKELAITTLMYAWTPHVSAGTVRPRPFHLSSDARHGF